MELWIRIGAFYLYSCPGEIYMNSLANHVGSI